MIIQLFIYNLFAIISNIYSFNIYHETIITIIYFASLIYIFDYIIPIYFHNKIKYYVDEYQNNTKLSKRILINYGILIIIYIWSDGLFTNLAINIFTFLYYNLITIPLSNLTHILFFYTHKHLHNTFNKIHNIHHQYNSPTATAGFHAHIFDILYTNVLPIYVPLYLFGVSREYKFSYILVALLDSNMSHISYYPTNQMIYKLCDFSNYHFIHHQNKMVNFGLKSAYMDKLYGTYVPHI